MPFENEETENLMDGVCEDKKGQGMPCPYNKKIIRAQNLGTTRAGYLCPKGEACGYLFIT